MENVDYSIIYDRALDLLSRRDHSRRELTAKLDRKFGRENEEQINNACDELERVGLLDDDRFARAYADELIRHKHVSPSGLRAALIHKGIPRDKAVLAVEESNIDAKVNIGILIDTKYKKYDITTEHGAYKVFNSLANMGFNYTDIKAVFYERVERDCSLDEIM